MDLKGKIIEEVVELPAGATQIIFEDGSFVITAWTPIYSDDLVGIDLVEPEKETEKETEKTVEKETEKETEKTVEKETEKETVAETSGDGPWTAEELDDMDREELIEAIDDEELDIDPKDYPKTKKLRAKLIEELVED